MPREGHGSRNVGWSIPVPEGMGVEIRLPCRKGWGARRHAPRGAWE